MLGWRVWAVLIMLLFSLNSNGRDLPPWTPGDLDIHQIYTGGGSTGFIIMPDGTTMLLDIGDMSDFRRFMRGSFLTTSLKPDHSYQAYQWADRYIRKMYPQVPGRIRQLDYALITHFHDDHFGEVGIERKYSERGGYQLFGITGIAELMSIKTLIDRGQAYPSDFEERLQRDAKSASWDDQKYAHSIWEYRKFIQYQTQKMGMKHEIFVPGSRVQLRMLYQPEEYPNFYIQNISVNNAIWTGSGQDVQYVMPESTWLGENEASCVLKIVYGPFVYFNGGDISGTMNGGQDNPNSRESLIAHLVGRVDVASANHHGNGSSSNALFIKTLQPRVWIIPAWSYDHPANSVLERMNSTLLYPGERDIFATETFTFYRADRKDLFKNYKSMHGHIVIRVQDGGKSYKVYVLDENSYDYPIVSEYGPYFSSGNKTS
jgi:hypothetical protein